MRTYFNISLKYYVTFEFENIFNRISQTLQISLNVIRNKYSRFEFENGYILQVTSMSLLQCVIATTATIWIFLRKQREMRFSPVLFLTPSIFMACTTITAGSIVHFDSSVKGVAIATSITVLALLIQIRNDLPTWFFPSSSKHSREDVMKNKADEHGVRVVSIVLLANFRYES